MIVPLRFAAWCAIIFLSPVSAEAAPLAFTEPTQAPSNFTDTVVAAGPNRNLPAVTAESEFSNAPASHPSASALDGVEVHAFVSQGYLNSTDNNFLARSEEGSFEFAEIGVNLTKPLTERLTLGGQFFAQSLGRLGKFGVKADWFQLDYKPADWFGLRVGRIKLPFGLFNDIRDIDAARNPILLPQSIYPAQNRDLLLAQSGAELYGDLSLRSAGALLYRIYGGTVVIDFESDPASPVQFSDIRSPYITGGRVLWDSPLEGFSLGGSVQLLRLEAEAVAPGLVTGPISLEGPALMWIGSADYTLGDLQLTAEYSRWRLSQESNMPAIFPEATVVSERMYAMAAYRLAAWLQPGAYYSLFFPDVSNRGVPEGRQGDLAATLRFDINQYWIFKAEGHLMFGTAGLSPQLNGGAPLSTLEDRWGLFLLKTTAYF